jgi:hypothetical protein
MRRTAQISVRVSDLRGEFPSVFGLPDGQMRGCAQAFRKEAPWDALSSG